MGGRIIQIGASTSNGACYISRLNNENPSRLISEIFKSPSWINTLINTSKPPNNSWTHIELSLDTTNTWRLFVGGNKQAESQYSGIGSTLTGTTLYIGQNNSGTEQWNGGVNWLRVTKGIARHTTDFTPPNKPFPNFWISNQIFNFSWH